MMSSQHAPYILGYTRTTMVRTMSCDPAKASQSQKPYLSSDCTLQLECMKVESLLLSFPLATKMFQFTKLSFSSL